MNAKQILSIVACVHSLVTMDHSFESHCGFDVSSPHTRPLSSDSGVFKPRGISIWGAFGNTGLGSGRHQRLQLAPQRTESEQIWPVHKAQTETGIPGQLLISKYCGIFGRLAQMNVLKELNSPFFLLVWGKTFPKNELMLPSCVVLLTGNLILESPYSRNSALHMIAHSYC